MRSRELGALLFGLAGLYTLLVALLGVAQLLPQVPRSGMVVNGQLQVQAAFVNSAVSVLLHLVFGFALYAARWRLAGRLLGEDDGEARAKGARGGRAAAVAAAPEPDAQALGIAAAAVCAVAILLLARFVTAAAYGVSLLLVHSNAGDLVAWTLGGIVVDLLMVVLGLILVVRRDRVARTLLRPLPPPGARAGGRPPQRGVSPGAGRPDAANDAGTAGTGGGPPWQLPALRFTGLALLVWHLPSLASALSVFAKWQLRPVGFDLRSQALYDIPPAATGVLAGLYLFLLFPAGLGAVWRRLRPLPPPPPAPPM